MNEKKQAYCLNCGNECHEGRILTRKERTYASEGSKEYEIDLLYRQFYTGLDRNLTTEDIARSQILKFHDASSL